MIKTVKCKDYQSKIARHSYMLGKHRRALFFLQQLRECSRTGKKWESFSLQEERGLSTHGGAKPRKVFLHKSGRHWLAAAGLAARHWSRPSQAGAGTQHYWDLSSLNIISQDRVSPTRDNLGSSTIEFSKKMLLRSLVPLSLLVGLALAGGDDGPGDPDFAANDGDLDSAVNPQVRSQKITC